jgi:hypothetical protein
MRPFLVELLGAFIEAGPLLQCVHAGRAKASFFKVRCLRACRPFERGWPGLMRSMEIPERSQQTESLERLKWGHPGWRRVRHRRAPAIDWRRAPDTGCGQRGLRARAPCSDRKAYIRLARDAGLPANPARRLAVEQTSGEPETLFHNRSRLPGHSAPSASLGWQKVSPMCPEQTVTHVTGWSHGRSKSLLPALAIIHSLQD